MKGVFLDLDSMHPQDLDLSALEGVLDDCVFHHATSPELVHERIADADVVISNKVVLGNEHFSIAKRLKLVCVAATGYNNIDTQAAQQHSIRVSNARAYATESVVEHVFTLLLALTRKLPQHQRAAIGGEWENSPYFCVLDYPMLELSSLTLGIIGFGELGQGVAKKAEQFGMNVLVAQSLTGKKKEKRVDLDTLLRESDVISLHCPLSPETQNLIDERALNEMKNTAYLINTARGGIVDETALATALRDKIIAGAGIDVLSKEPPDSNNPLLASDLPGLILTPHIAWAGRNSRQKLLQEIADNIAAFKKGQTRNVVV